MGLFSKKSEPITGDWFDEDTRAKVNEAAQKRGVQQPFDNDGDRTVPDRKK